MNSNFQLIARIKDAMAKSNQRFLLGICGAPGSGKSTLSHWIVEEWNRTSPDSAVLMPMDGYHFSNEELQEKGLLALKGIPATFDSESFVQKLESIRLEPNIDHHCPRFDRSIEASIPDAITVESIHKLVVVEGTYLLLNTSPWNKLKELFDETWFIEANEALIFPRLLSRHMEAGKSEEMAREKVNSTDLPNARLVNECAQRADFIVRTGTVSQ